MNLKAYTQIEDLEYILHKQNIEIPRLRGLSLMSEEKPISEEELNDIIKERTFRVAKDIIEQGCLDYWCSWLDYPRKKKLRYEKHSFWNEVVEIHWENIHGKTRKRLKFEMKKKKKEVLNQFNMHNSFVGRDDILYVHARIGGSNWNDYDGPKVAKNPYFISKADDSFDNTYCDMYFKIDKEKLAEEEEK